MKTFSKIPDTIGAGKNQKSKFFVFSLIVVLFLNIIPARANAAISTGTIFSLTNSARTQNGLSTLSINSQLNTAAQMKAQNMLDKGYFAHTSPEGLNSWYWFKQVGYNYKTAGENLAIDFSDSNRVFSAWMASPSHRDNILDKDFNEIGIAALTGNFNGSITTVVVQMFGTQNSASKSNSVINKKNNVQTVANAQISNNENNSNQINNLENLNKMFSELKITINNMSINYKQIFYNQIFLVMLI